MIRKYVHRFIGPFAKKWLFFDRVLNEEVYQWPKISGRVIVTSDLPGEAYVHAR